GYESNSSYALSPLRIRTEFEATLFFSPACAHWYWRSGFRPLPGPSSLASHLSKGFPPAQDQYSITMSNPVGIAVSHTTDLHGELTFFHDLGYDAVEISPDAFDLIFCGRLHSPLVNDVVPVLERHGFRYSVHSPAALDLRDLRDHELQVQMAESVVEFCRLIHAEVLVLHFEQQSADPAVEAAFLAARYFGFDYLEAVRAAGPLLIHLHVTDNFGRYDPLRLENFTLYRTQRSRDIFPVGRGDLHLPVGWGAIPYDQTFAALRGYQGSVITEYRYNLFRPHAQRLAQQLRSMVRRLGP